MAVGKTTILKYIEHKKIIHCCYEDNQHIIKEIKYRNLQKNILEDYLEIQKLWIKNEIIKIDKFLKYKYSLMDFGAEGIEFYTLNYPKTINKSWDIENLLKEDLNNLRAYLPERILFLNADYKTLLNNKNNDKSRNRTFFDYQYHNILPLKKKWFKIKSNVDFVDVDNPFNLHNINNPTRRRTINI